MRLSSAFLVISALAISVHAQDARVMDDSRVHVQAQPNPVLEATPSDLGVRCQPTTGPDGSQVWTDCNPPHPHPTPISTPSSASSLPGWMIAIKRMAEMTLLGHSAGAEKDQLAERDARDQLDGVFRITDDNVNILNNGSTWVVLVHGVKQDPIDKHYLDSHGNATKLIDPDAKGEPQDIRFGRLDYMREWKACTRWMIFRSPVMFVYDNSQFRFLKHGHLYQGGESLARFLNLRYWKTLDTWNGYFSPTGPGSWAPELYITVWDKASTYLSGIPHFAWLAIMAGLTRGLISWMHSWGRGSGATPATPATPAAKPASAEARAEALRKQLKDRQQARAKKGGKAE